ncbi:MAG TPA: 2-oxo-4-hydroxy-4-carboxy-5-ureidoimidazoline decarboxylase [Thermoleophilia bacterium]|nr:2-oxo-4-hydroxy-4-carboxy-5-ureidoimidazoline decarboxylase [Thermoleophilia bacterium]
MHESQDVAWLDVLPLAEARRELSACCASQRWTSLVATARPLRTWANLLDTAMGALATLSWEDILEALSAHPMIGQRADGDGLQAAWSRAEQAGTHSASAEVAARLRALNLEYQERFGHVFLICASGLPAEVMLRALKHRLRNTHAAEQRATRAELAAITRLRLERLSQSARVTKAGAEARAS